jgi:hypothetical protein
MNTVGEGQGRALLLALGAVEECLPQLIAGEWLRYARERFDIPSARASRARHELDAIVSREYDRMRKQAQRQGAALPFTGQRLKFFAVKALEYACPFCVELFGVLNVGIVWDTEPSALMTDAFAMINIIVCCELCARGKGSLTASQWLDVLQAFRSADEAAQRRAREAMAAGREVVDGRRASRYFQEGGPRG